MENLPQSRSCFACGQSNPQGLDLKFASDGKIVQTHWIPQAHHTGFANTIHGGLTATVLDEIMAWTCGILGGRFAYSVEMTVRYQSPLEPGERVQGIGRLVENRRSKIFQTEATLQVGDRAVASASGKYLAVQAEVEEALWNDFGGTAEQIKKLRSGGTPA